MLNERELTKKELEAREKAMKDLKTNKRSFVKRYGKDAEAVMYGRATNIAKKQAENMNKEKLRELIKDKLKNPVKEMDIEVGADRYGAEQDLSQVSSMMDTLEAKLKAHDWYYMMSDDHRVYQNGSYEQQEIRSIMKDLEGLGYGKDAKDLFNQYAPHQEGGPSFRMKEDEYQAYKDGVTQDSSDMAMKQAGMKEAKGEVDEDLDLGHEDNEPHMIKAELYRIGKYAMELYAMLEEFDEMGGEVDFPGWWQAKITTAANNMISAKHYLDFEIKEPAIDAAVDALTGEKPHMEEPEMGVEMEDEMSIREEAPGKVDMLAAKIAKALKSNISDEDQENLKQARKAMNDGNIEAAKKILQPYINNLKANKPAFKKKSLEEYIADGVIDENVLDRLAANVKGATSFVSTGLGNLGKSFMGKSLQDPKYAAGISKLSVKAKGLSKKLNDTLNDIEKLFPPDKVSQTPALAAIINAYKQALINADKTTIDIASGRMTPGNSNSPQTPEQPTPKPAAPKPTPKPATPKSEPTGRARDEKGRFTSTKTTSTKSTSTPKTEPISDKYEVTNNIYNYKGKDYTVQVDKDTKEKFFKNDDGRIMDISSLEKFSQAKKKAVAEKLAKQLKSR